ncbi:permease [Tamlana nanhaiensis]|uniref:Permease n=1 Tax=Neotamlana nanhaiensis TaxID=1382798 RepID=A0A0D7W9B6_9FLAO|nr:ABC transporter permease [Tamlana nanhaiensis]KJD34382.1 permease [Tamlana nanhaiensis]
MNIWKISIKNLLHKPLYTALSVLALTISIGLLISIKQLDATLKQQFENNLADIDLVVGAKGSPLQLVLASVLHIDNPTGNISYDEAKKISKNRLVEMAIPMSYGDNFKGYRIVGSNISFSKFYKAEIEKGHDFKSPMEVVLGSDVANALQLKIGDTFLSSHGLAEEGSHEHPENFVVVGIYKQTHKVIDRLIVTPLESIWDVHNHEENEEHPSEESHHHAEENHHKAHNEETHNDQEITSLLVKFKNPMGLLRLPRQINSNTNMQAAIPKYEMERLFGFTGIGVKAISWIAYAILLISSLIIFINLFKMVKERAFDLALLRTYGASNFQLIKIVAYEGFVATFAAIFIGLILSKVGLFFVFKMLSNQFKQTIPQSLEFSNVITVLSWVMVMVVLAILLAILPILKMNVSKILSHEK